MAQNSLDYKEWNSKLPTVQKNKRFPSVYPNLDMSWIIGKCKSEKKIHQVLWLFISSEFYWIIINNNNTVIRYSLVFLSNVICKKFPNVSVLWYMHCPWIHFLKPLFGNVYTVCAFFLTVLLVWKMYHLCPLINRNQDIFCHRFVCILRNGKSEKKKQYKWCIHKWKLFKRKLYIYIVRPNC